MIEKAKLFARQIFSGDASGHDFDHTLRVCRMAVRLAREEGADVQTVALAALLHDVDDRKISPQTCENLDNARRFLRENGADDEKIRQITDIISRISFSGGGVPDSIEGKCVQDADRLDAIGAVGIARTFAFGGSRGRRLHDPAGEDNTSSIAHFHEKLLLLKDRMNTPTGKALAMQRHDYMLSFLEQFHAEWAGER
jgi:uncharacterized protein